MLHYFAGVFTKPSLGDLQLKRTGPTIPVAVICDNVRDPGNMGALIRSVAAAGCQQMFLMKGEFFLARVKLNFSIILLFPHGCTLVAPRAK